MVKGEKVPASEKIVSIFDDHTDIIKWGKSLSPTEFGHKVLITTAKSGLITHYQAFRDNPDDAHMILLLWRSIKNNMGVLLTSSVVTVVFSAWIMSD